MPINQFFLSTLYKEQRAKRLLTKKRKNFFKIKKEDKKFYRDKKDDVSNSSSSSIEEDSYSDQQSNKKRKNNSIFLYEFENPEINDRILKKLRTGDRDIFLINKEKIEDYSTHDFQKDTIVRLKNRNFFSFLK